MQREQVLAQIKSNISCLDYLDQAKHGGYICPKCGSGTHRHQSGAVKYYADTNTWYCHSCNHGGDVMELVMLTFNIDYNAALQYGADQLSLSVDKWSGAAAAPTKQEVDYTAYYKLCAKRLERSTAAISYLSARGISLDTAKVLNIGYDPKAAPATNPGAIDSSGNKYPAPRLIIPTSQSHYVGRSIESNSKYSKINNAGGTPSIFNSDALYHSDVVFVSEGVFDAMSYIEIGAAAVALSSAGNTDKLLEQLQRQPAAADTKFVVAFDNDTDPKTAASVGAAADKLVQGLQKQGYKAIRFNTAGSCKDANELLQVNKGGFIQCVSAAMAAVAAAAQPADTDFVSEFLTKVQTDIYKPIPTGLTFFDDLLGGGVMPQTLFILLAQPGVGKTTLCQQLAEEMAAHQKPIVYINLEMSREQLFAKALSYRLTKSGINQTALHILQGYKWTDKDRQLITAAAAAYRRDIYPYLRYNPQTSSDIDTILDYLQGLGEQARKDGKDAPAVVLDYIHLCSSSRKLDEQELLKYVVTGLKRYAINYNTFAIAISAINRASGDNVKLTSGRGSSNIEYTGDYQLSLNYHDKADTPAQELERQQQRWRRLDLSVLKGRFIPIGKTAHLYFNAANNIFYGERDAMPIDNNRIPFDISLTNTTIKAKRL